MVNTVGIVLVSRCNAAVAGVVAVRMTSGRSATSSVAKAFARLLSAFVQRCSMRAFQPNRVNSSMNALKKDRCSGLLSDRPNSTPITGIAGP